MANRNSSTSNALDGTGMTIHAGDRRVTPRFRVQFRTVVSDKSTMVEHIGTIRDLSMTGCRVESPVSVEQPAVMELRIYVPDLDWPLMVDEAVVQWANSTIFGVHFRKMRRGVEDRLAWVIARLVEDADRQSWA
jgi:PilZ domain